MQLHSPVRSLPKEAPWQIAEITAEGIFLPWSDTALGTCKRFVLSHFKVLQCFLLIKEGLEGMLAT